MVLIDTIYDIHKYAKLALKLYHSLIWTYSLRIKIPMLSVLGWSGYLDTRRSLTKGVFIAIV